MQHGKSKPRRKMMAKSKIKATKQKQLPQGISKPWRWSCTKRYTVHSDDGLELGISKPSVRIVAPWEMKATEQMGCSKRLSIHQTMGNQIIAEMSAAGSKAPQ